MAMTEPPLYSIIDYDRDDEDDDEDNVSIVSRSPSPPPDTMNIEEESLDKYDEYIRKPVAPEVITVETPIKSTNKGFAMLAKLGWVEGQPLGISGQGRVEPIPFQMKSDSTGLGKGRQDAEMIETTVSQRRELDSERQQKESDEQRRVREVDAVARKTAVAEEISDTLKAFYCSLCDKQFKNVAQYDEHTNSYAHHHKARFRDMQANARIKPKEEIDKRKEKERKREERELRKIAAASGVKMAKSALPPSGAPAPAPAASETETAFKSSGWAPVSSSTSGSSSVGPKKAGWAAVSSTLSQSLPVSDPPLSGGGGGFKKAGWAAVGSTTASSTLPSSGGWKTPMNLAALPTPPELTASSPPQHPPSKSHLSRVGWQQFQKKNSRRH
ncbi:hypothetical protein GYMLUDRAFT_90240 [Collybiopsis luxurians FD-317 M1]|nr:hypothetical protein GYMLUDRAFT_90240 [Collybiopsis luxurians FD-317 M1]